MTEISEDAQRILTNLAKTKEGCIALCQLITAEMENVSRLIDGAVKRCELDELLNKTVRIADETYGPEPTLNDLILRYYKSFFDDEPAKERARLYVQGLTNE